MMLFIFIEKHGYRIIDFPMNVKLSTKIEMYKVCLERVQPLLI